MATDKERITFYVQPHMKQEIEALAAEECLTITMWISKVIAEKLNKIRLEQITALKKNVGLSDSDEVISYKAPQEWLMCSGYKGNTAAADAAYSIEIALRKKQLSK